METSSYLVGISQDILEFLTGRMARLEANEETPAELPSKDQQALKKDYDLLEFSINTAEEFKKAVRKTRGACAKIFRRLLITYNLCQIEAEHRMDAFPTTACLWKFCKEGIMKMKGEYNTLKF